jgi:hypothetical protein
MGAGRTVAVVVDIAPELRRVFVLVRRRMFVMVRVFMAMGVAVPGTVGVDVLVRMVRRVVMMVMLAGVVVRMAVNRAVRMIVHMGVRVAVIGAVLVTVTLVAVSRRMAVAGPVGVNVPVRIVGVLGRDRLPFDTGFSGATAASRAHRRLLGKPLRCGPCFGPCPGFVARRAVILLRVP